MNQVTLDSYTSGLGSGDAPIIAGYMRDIDELVRQAGGRAAFIIPPVYETDREGMADEIMSLPLDSLPEDQRIPENIEGIPTDVEVMDSLKAR